MACVVLSSPGLRSVTGPVPSVLMPPGVEAGGSVSAGVPACPSAPGLGMPCSFPEDTQGGGRESIVRSTQEMPMGQAMGQTNVSSALGSSPGGRWPGPPQGDSTVQVAVRGTHAVSQPWRRTRAAGRGAEGPRGARGRGHGFPPAAPACGTLSGGKASPHPITRGRPQKLAPREGQSHGPPCATPVSPGPGSRAQPSRGISVLLDARQEWP